MHAVSRARGLRVLCPSSDPKKPGCWDSIGDRRAREQSHHLLLHVPPPTPLSPPTGAGRGFFHSIFCKHGRAPPPAVQRSLHFGVSEQTCFSLVPRSRAREHLPFVRQWRRSNGSHGLTWVARVSTPGVPRGAPRAADCTGHPGCWGTDGRAHLSPSLSLCRWLFKKWVFFFFFYKLKLIQI